MKWKPCYGYQKQQLLSSRAILEKADKGRKEKTVDGNAFVKGRISFDSEIQFHLPHWNLLNIYTQKCYKKYHCPGGRLYPPSTREWSIIHILEKHSGLVTIQLPWGEGGVDRREEDSQQHQNTGKIRFHQRRINLSLCKRSYFSWRNQLLGVH